MGMSSAPPHAPTGRWGSVVVLTLVGGAAFWVANFLISLTPIAAEYRAGLSISYLPMLLEALVGGLTLACGVSLVVVRFSDRVPGRDPLTKSFLMSVLVFVLVTVAIEIPAKLFGGIPDAVRYFVTGTVFNAIRILALGVAIGAVARRLDRTRQSPPAPNPSLT
jgi:hypothetical protein